MSAAGVRGPVDALATGVPGIPFDEDLVSGDEVRGAGTLSLDVPPITVDLLKVDIAVGEGRHPDVLNSHRS